MRTSRISRETARVVDALAQPSNGAGALRRSLRGFQNGAQPAQSVTTDPADSGSDLSTPPSSPGTPRKASNASLGKRKRTNGAARAQNEGNNTTRGLRRTPRKAPKLEDSDSDYSDNAIKQEPGESDYSHASIKQEQRTPRRKPAKRITGPTTNNASPREPGQPPPGWERMYNLTATMRKRFIAPVDTMGCETLAESHRSPLDKRLQTLVALMLSSQTKDPVTAAAMANLQANLPGGFNLAALLAVDPEVLNELIGKVGFHNNKTKFIKRTAEILRDSWGGDIPDSIEGLTSLPGVGPKMAHLTMSAAWGRTLGIGVDVHVHRITNLWGWHRTRNAEETRRELEGWLPREKWHEINHLLVGLGQVVCLPVGRRCGECDLAGEGVCPSAVEGSPVKKRRVKKVEVEIGGGEGGEGVVKKEEVKVESDDVGIKVEADLEGEGAVEVQAIAGAPQIKGEEGDGP